MRRRFNEAVALQARNLPRDALRVYEQALKLKPDLCEALLNAGTIVQKLGDPDEV
jgi:tetratricopeptide (TPR) repeat protein